MIKKIENQIEKVSIYFTIAELKATLNAFLMPLLLIVLSNNILTGLCWVLLITVIYETIQKEKVENAKMFYMFLFVESGILLSLGIIVVLLTAF